MARHSIRGLATAAVAAASLAAAWQSQAAERRPNVVLIVTDDQGYADFGFQGSTRVRTPHIDALARAGVRMRQAYVSHPYCSPTRAGLLTGRYQQRFGHENNPAFLPENHEIGLPAGEATLADLLAGAGYATGLVGKWHLGAAPPFHPRRRGFDEFFGFLGGGRNYFLSPAAGDVETEEYRAKLDHLAGSAAGASSGAGAGHAAYLTDALSDHAVDFIRRHRERPFFLYLAYSAPHTPYQAPERYRRRFAGIAEDECRTYAAMISAVDDGVGRVLDTLRQLGIDRHTLIFLLSDNGGQTLYQCPDNAPLRGGKGSLYDGGVRVPFLVAWPGRLEAGGSFEAPVSSLDVFATAAAVAGARPARAVDGVDLLPFLTGEREVAPHPALYWRVGGGAGWAVRSGRFKLIGRRGGGELYDLEADAGETRDLAAEQPHKVRELRALYRAWNAELVPPRWNNPR